MKLGLAARAVTVTAWLTGMTLILAGLPLPAALIPPVAAAAGIATYPKWGGRVRGAAGAVTARLRRRAQHTGSDLEHA